MSYSCKVILDSVNTVGDRLTTLEVTYPRFIHAEFMTHRVFSRNAASSRAIPIQKMIDRVKEDPVIPVVFGRNQKGMQSSRELEGDDLLRARWRWLSGRDEAVFAAETLTVSGVHKQIVNRLLEPWMWITVLVSATTWSNFLNLRQDWTLPAGIIEIREMVNLDFPAQPEMQVIAYLMRQSLGKSIPTVVNKGDWHLPLVVGNDHSELVDEDGYDLAALRSISAGRCARVSYLTHDGKRDPKEDIRLYNDLINDWHWSPFEHPAMATPGKGTGNFTGWTQYRSFFPDESGQ
jgi:thymidylate synthase ThyX